jgi:hypothetical protein
MSTGEKRQRWFEVCLVLLAACGSSILNALFILRNGPNSFSKDGRSAFSKKLSHCYCWDTFCHDETSGSGAWVFVGE